MPQSHARLLPVSLVVVLIALLTLPMAVSAAPPLVETFTREGSITFREPCPNGDLLVETFTEETRITTFFDKQGNPVRVQIKVNYSGVVTNTTTGASVRNPGHYTITDDLVAGTSTQVGLTFSVTVPGVGVVFHDVGRVVFDAEFNAIFEAGPHDVLNTEGAHPVRANFCEALT